MKIILNETGSLNLVYHGTSGNNALNILSSNILKVGKLYSNVKPAVCVTRDYNFVKKRRFNVILILDKDKLKFNYKLQPITDNKNSVNQKSQPARYEISKAEEVIYKQITNIKNYIHGIIVDDSIYDQFINIITKNKLIDNIAIYKKSEYNKKHLEESVKNQEKTLYYNHDYNIYNKKPIIMIESVVDANTNKLCNILYKILKVRFKNDTKPLERSFLLTDGTFISTDESKSNTSDYSPHYQIDNFIGNFVFDYLGKSYDHYRNYAEEEKLKAQQDYNITDDEIQYLFDNIDWDKCGNNYGCPILEELGCIRLNGGYEHYIVIPSSDYVAGLTSNQIIKLESWLDIFGVVKHSVKEGYIQVDTADGFEYCNYNLFETSISSIINKINNYYKSGDLIEELDKNKSKFKTIDEMGDQIIIKDELHQCSTYNLYECCKHILFNILSDDIAICIDSLQSIADLSKIKSIEYADDSFKESDIIDFADKYDNMQNINFGGAYLVTNLDGSKFLAYWLNLQYELHRINLNADNTFDLSAFNDIILDLDEKFKSKGKEN